jgi:hypothetical protein
MAKLFFVSEKFCRVHKNQAVNLLQIPIHAPDVVSFLNRDGVKLRESRSPTAFVAKQGYCHQNTFRPAIAAKFLQTKSWILLQEGNTTPKDNYTASVYTTWLKRIC